MSFYYIGPARDQNPVLCNRFLVKSLIGKYYNADNRTWGPEQAATVYDSVEETPDSLEYNGHLLDSDLIIDGGFFVERLYYFEGSDEPFAGTLTI